MNVLRIRVAPRRHPILGCTRLERGTTSWGVSRGERCGGGGEKRQARRWRWTRQRPPCRLDAVGPWGMGWGRPCLACCAQAPPLLSGRVGRGVHAVARALFHARHPEEVGHDADACGGPAGRGPQTAQADAWPTAGWAVQGLLRG